jgi:hypothetical protein
LFWEQQQQPKMIIQANSMFIITIIINICSTVQPAVSRLDDFILLVARGLILFVID